MIAAVLSLLENDELALNLSEIAVVLRETVAMPRAAEAIEEASRRLKGKQDARN